MQITNKVILITGAGNGIGRQVALLLASKGARIAAVDLDAESLAETAKLAVKSLHPMTIHVTNVSESAAVDALVADVLAAHQHVDGIVNVAGIIHRFTPMSDLSRGEMERVMNVNFWGTVNITQAFLPMLCSRPIAGVVNISSLSGLTAFTGQGFYGVSKAAVKLYTEALYQELADTNVSVTAVFPGNISTNISGNSGVKMLDAGGKGLPPTTPEETARLIVKALETGTPRVVIGKDAKVLSVLSRLAPITALKVVAKAMKSVMKPSESQATK